MAGDDSEMFMTRSLNVTLKTTEQHLIARSDKYVANVTNSKRLRSTLCSTVANYTDRHEASRSVFATAELLVLISMKLKMRTHKLHKRLSQLRISTFVNKHYTNRYFTIQL